MRLIRYADGLAADGVDVVGAAVGIEQQWWRVAATGQMDVKTVVAPGQFPVDQSAEPVEFAAEFLAEDGVEVVQHFYRVVVVDRRGAQRVPGQPGHHRGIDTLARNIAQEEAPRRTREREEVIEVAAHVVDRSRVVVLGGLQTGGR